VDMMTSMMGLGWAGTMVATLATMVFVIWLSDRRPRPVL